jgi:hypothetical protein
VHALCLKSYIWKRTESGTRSPRRVPMRFEGRAFRYFGKHGPSATLVPSHLRDPEPKLQRLEKERFAFGSGKQWRGSLGVTSVRQLERVSRRKLLADCSSGKRATRRQRCGRYEVICDLRRSCRGSIRVLSVLVKS